MPAQPVICDRCGAYHAHFDTAVIALTATEALIVCADRAMCDRTIAQAIMDAEMDRRDHHLWQQTHPSIRQEHHA